MGGMMTEKMTAMECSLDTRKDSGFRGKEYFSSDLLPRTLKARHFRLEGERVLGNGEDVTVFYIRRGRGSVTLNNRQYALEPGQMFLLFPFHSGTVRVPEGAVLEGEECVLNMGALLFMLAIPPYRRPVPVFEENPSFYQLKGELRGRIEDLWDRILKENRSEDCYGGKMQFGLLMRILVLCRKHGAVIERSGF